MWLIGCLLLVESVLAVVGLVQLWPTLDDVAVSSPAEAEAQATGDNEVAAGRPDARTEGGFDLTDRSTWRSSPETVYVLLVVAASVLGGVLHAVVSFSRHVGQGTFAGTWAWWYVLRPFTGVALALLVYFVIRGGLLTTVFGSEALSPYGVAAVAGLAGFFARQTTDKLEEVIQTLFGTGEATAKAAPVVTELDPPALTAGAGDTAVGVVGKNFTRETTVHIDGVARPTYYQDAGHINVLLRSDLLTQPTSLTLVAVTPGPRGGESASVELQVQ